MVSKYGLVWLCSKFRFQTKVFFFLLFSLNWGIKVRVCLALLKIYASNKGLVELSSKFRFQNRVKFGFVLNLGFKIGVSLA